LSSDQLKTLGDLFRLACARHVSEWIVPGTYGDNNGDEE
jgi:hypothetical protein